MTRIVDLDALVPEDIEFQYRGGKYLIPGDIQGPDVFRLIRLFERHADAESKDITDAEEIVREVGEALLGLFQQRQPELESLPFGLIAYMHVLVAVLEALHLKVSDTPDPPTLKPTRKPQTGRSRRSSGSGGSRSTR